jgi:peroxiredoxin
MTLFSSNADSSPPQPGQTATDFELPDSTGATQRLSDLTASGPLVLLFYRGHW